MKAGRASASGCIRVNDISSIRTQSREKMLGEGALLVVMTEHVIVIFSDLIARKLSMTVNAYAPYRPVRGDNNASRQEGSGREVSERVSIQVRRGKEGVFDAVSTE